MRLAFDPMRPFAALHPQKQDEAPPSHEGSFFEAIGIPVPRSPRYRSSSLFGPVTSFVDNLMAAPSSDRSAKSIATSLKKMGYSEEDAQVLVDGFMNSVEPKELESVASGLKYAQSKGWNAEYLQRVMDVVGRHDIPIEEIFRLVLRSKGADLTGEFIDIIEENNIRFNIRHFGRFTFDMMKDNLIDGPSDKVALAVYAGYDHNGALYDDTDFLKQIAAKNYQLRIHEATSADDFMKAVTSTKKASGKIDILFINAHGNVDGITLEDSDTGYMGISDFKALDETKLRELKRCFSVDARVILSSCSTGEGGPLSQNFANSMQGSFGVKYLYACEKTCSTDSLLWDKYGRLKQVKWNEDESSHTNKAFSRYQEVLADIDPELKDWIVANIIRSEDLSSNDDYDMIFERILFVKDIMPKVSDFEGLIKTLPGNKEKINRDIERMISDGATATNIELQYLGDYGVPELVFDIQSNSNCDLGTDRPLSEFNIKKMVGKLRVMHHRSKYKSSKVKRVSYDSGYGLIQNNEKNSELVMKGFIDENLEMLLKQVHPDNRKKVKQEIIDSAKECGTFQDAKDIFDAAVSSNPGEYAFISLFDFMPADERLKSAKFLFDSIDKRHSKEKIEQKFLSAN